MLPVTVLYQNLGLHLVEVAGIEPASEGKATGASTSVAPGLVFAAQPLRSKMLHRLSP